MFTKGHKLGVGNKGGRRPSVKEEIEAAKEMITQDALIKLANSKVYKQLVKIQGFKDTKEMALPITIKGIVQKIGGDPDNPLIVQISEIIAKKRGITSETK